MQFPGIHSHTHAQKMRAEEAEMLTLQGIVGRGEEGVHGKTSFEFCALSYLFIARRVVAGHKTFSQQPLGNLLGAAGIEIVAAIVCSK